MNNKINWQHWQYFLAITEQGSLNKAANVLEVSQPTLSRQMLALEKRLGQPLFNRSTRGLSLTEFGAELIEEGHVMQRSAERLNRLAQGQSQELKGQLRLSTNQLIAQYYLPTILPNFIDQYPNIFLEIEVNNQASNIDKRDADIAIRMFPPTQLDLVVRHLFDIPLGFYASQKYIDKHGIPDSAVNLFKQHRILGYDRDTQFEQGARNLNQSIQNEDFRFRTDFMPLQFETAVYGGGIVIAHESLCRRFNLIKMNVDITLPMLPVFLVCHRDVQHNKRIRALMEFLAKNLSTAVNG